MFWNQQWATHSTYDDADLQVFSATKSDLPVNPIT
jgi:hypothetical protein